jgi:hypothetical protein
VAVSQRKPCRIGIVQSFLRERRQEKYAVRQWSVQGER